MLQSFRSLLTPQTYAHVGYAEDEQQGKQDGEVIIGQRLSSQAITALAHPYAADALFRRLMPILYVDVSVSHEAGCRNRPWVYLRHFLENILDSSDDDVYALSLHHDCAQHRPIIRNGIIGVLLRKTNWYMDAKYLATDQAFRTLP